MADNKQPEKSVRTGDSKPSETPKQTVSQTIKRNGEFANRLRKVIGDLHAQVPSQVSAILSGFTPLIGMRGDIDDRFPVTVHRHPLHPQRRGPKGSTWDVLLFHVATAVYSVNACLQDLSLPNTAAEEGVRHLEILVLNGIKNSVVSGSSAEGYYLQELMGG